MTLAKSIRFAAVLVVLAGYLLVVREGERRIGERLAANAELVERLASDHRLLAMRAGLERERTRLRSSLRRAGIRAEHGPVVSTFLRDAAAVAAARGTKVTSVTANGPSLTAPAPAAPAPAAGTPNTETPNAGTPNAPFDTVAFELAVEGRYADILATVRDLSANSHALASVEIASLARKNTSHGGAILSASLKVVLHRLGAPAIPSGATVPVSARDVAPPMPAHAAQPIRSERSDVRTRPA
jgi:hypothetical protein